MPTSDVNPNGLNASFLDAEHGAHLRRALIASTVGTTIEWYDFLLYGTVTGLVFGKLYFPGSSPIIGVLEAFGVFFIGFVGRPIGAAIFGHYGDRIGRKATLIVTLLLTGIATCAVGLVPTYESIGVWGAVLLTFIRLVQGIGVGGEWGGSVLLAMEWARTNHNRGFIASWPQFGARWDCSLRTRQSCSSVGCRVISSSCGGGGSHSFSALSWSTLDCGFGWASWKPRCSRKSSKPIS
jgi:MFS family permease